MDCGKQIFFKNGTLNIIDDNGNCIPLQFSPAVTGGVGGRGSRGQKGDKGDNALDYVQYDNNNITVPNNDTLVQIPLAIATVEPGSTIDNRVDDQYKIPFTGMYNICFAGQQADSQMNMAFIGFTINRNGVEFKATQITIDVTDHGLNGALNLTQKFQKDDLLTFFMVNNKDNNTTLFNTQVAIVLLKKP